MGWDGMFNLNYYCLSDEFFLQKDKRKKMMGLSCFFFDCFLFFLSFVYDYFFFCNDFYKMFLNEDVESGILLFLMFMRWLSLIKIYRIFSNQGYVQCFDFKMLEKVIGGFKDSNVIGQGGFGCVYKVFLDSNIKVVVKKIENVI